MTKQITARYNVDLHELANKLASDFNLPLTLNSDLQENFQKIDLVLDKKHGLESLCIARNYSQNTLDFEQFTIDYFLGENEVIIASYFTSNPKYFQRIFQDIGETENEFLAAIKQDYNKISKNKKSIFYKKRVLNDQKALEDLFYYAAFRFKGVKSSKLSQSE